jgi:hypothetical protein
MLVLETLESAKKRNGNIIAVKKRLFTQHFPLHPVASSVNDQCSPACGCAVLCCAVLCVHGLLYDTTVSCR